MVGTDRKELNVQLFELTVIDHPGLEIRGSRGVEVQTVELEQHMFFALELAQADRCACGAWQGEVGSLFSHVRGCGHVRSDEETSMKKHNSREWGVACVHMSLSSLLRVTESDCPPPLPLSGQYSTAHERTPCLMERQIS